MKRALFVLPLLLAAAALATVTTTSSTVSYTGNGSTTVFAVPFPFLLSSDLQVKETADGVTTTKTLTTHYTVIGAGGSSGSVTMLTAPASGVTLSIERVVPYTQATNFRTQGTFNPATHERALDKLTMAVQQLDTRVGSIAGVSDAGASIPAESWKVLQRGDAGESYVTTDNSVTAKVGRGGISTDGGVYVQHGNVHIDNGSLTVDGQLDVNGDIEGGDTVVSSLEVSGAARIGSDTSLEGQAVFQGAATGSLGSCAHSGYTSEGCLQWDTTTDTFKYATEGSSTWTPIGGEQVYAYYTLNSAKTIVNTVTTRLDWDTEVEDSHSAVTTGASWKFTAPSPGRYGFVASVHFQVATNATAFFANATGGREMIFQSYWPDTNQWHSVGGSGAFNLTAGQEIWFQVNHAGGGSADIGGTADGVRDFVQIYKLN